MHQSERLHALDAVRAFALLLGIVLHASLSFLPGGYFVIEDNSQSALLRVSFYVIHIFRMSAFFLIAGFFARLMLERRGTVAFIKDRALRIGLVLASGWIVCTLLIRLAFSWAIAQQYGFWVSPARFGWPWLWLTHLWFLYYLLWMYPIALAVRRLWSFLDRSGAARQVIDGTVKFVVTRDLLPVVAAVPTAWLLYSIDPWYEWGGIPTPDQWLLPRRPALLGYGIAFSLGWLLQRQPELLQVWERRWQRYLAAAVVFVTLSHGMVDGRNNVQMLGVDKALYATSYALATWTTVLAVLGLGMRFCATASPLRRYLADSSYWLYVAHVPVVFGLQAAVMRLRLHWSLKFSFIMLVTCGTLLLTYHYWVRPTALGALLNGRRQPRTPLSALWRAAPAEHPPAGSNSAGRPP